MVYTTGPFKYLAKLTRRCLWRNIAFMKLQAEKILKGKQENTYVRVSLVTQSSMLNENKVFLVFKIFKEDVPQRVLFLWKDCSMCNQILQAASISDKKFKIFNFKCSFFFWNIFKFDISLGRGFPKIQHFFFFLLIFRKFKKI